MTQAKAAKLLIEKAESSGKTVKVIHVDVGHHQMSEAPEQTLTAIKDFLN